ncbi:MAG: hypothetical protein ACRC6V_13545 [Bacteroidales bacterium]
MQYKHEKDMALISSGVNQPGSVTYVAGNEHNTEVPTPSYNQVVSNPDSNVASDSGSSILGTVAAVGAGALAGYAISELLDDGYRSYTGSNGRTYYVDSNNREITRSQYESYKKEHPTKHKVSEYNQKGKTLVKAGQEKTVQAATVVKEKTTQAATSVQKKVSSTVSKPAPRPASRPTTRK